MAQHNDWSAIIATVVFLLLLAALGWLMAKILGLRRRVHPSETEHEARPSPEKKASTRVETKARPAEKIASGPADLPVQVPAITVTPSARVAGSLLWALLAEMPVWVERRVEHIELMDARSARRTVSLDFTPPANLMAGQGAKMVRQAGLFVPLGLLRKDPLKGFDLRDQRGNPVPLLSREQNAQLSGEALVASAESALGGTCPPDIVRALHELAVGSINDATVALESWKAAASEPKAALDYVWKRLLQHDEFVDLLQLLAENFVLAAATPLAPGDRRLMKFSYVEPIPDELSWTRRILRAIGWIHATVTLDLPAASQARSYHVEIPAPPNVEINEAFFDFSPRPPRSGASALAMASPVPLYRPERCEERQAGALSHLNASRVDPRLKTRVVVRFRPQRAGLIRYALATSFVVWTLLGLSLLRLQNVSSDPGAAVPLLVVVPGILAVIIVRPGEHALASRLFIGIRLIVSLSAFSALLAAAFLLVGFCGTTLHWLWVGVFALATGCMGALLVSHSVPLAAEPAGYRWT
jgi:hypothetical protein